MTAVPWTFDHGGDVAERWEWLTDVLSARTGPDQSRRLRQDPRVGLTFEGQASGIARRRLETQLWHHAAGRWWAPLVMDARSLSSPAVAGTDQLALDTRHARFRVGGRALLGHPGGTWELVTIDAVTDGALMLDGVTMGSWPAMSRVVPVREAELAEAPQLGRFTADDTALFQVQFRLVEELQSPSLADPVLYRGWPVFDVRPSWSSDPVWQPARDVVSVDEGVAPPTTFDPAGAARPRLVFHFIVSGSADIARFRGWLALMGGRWSPVWVPTWGRDVRVVADVAAGAAALDVEGPDLSSQSLVSNRRDLRIELRNGTVLYRRITAAVPQTLTRDRLTVDGPFPDAFGASDVVLASYLTLCRQDADVNLMRFFDHQTIQCEVAFRGEVHAL